jgi:N-acyl-D-aspartate/D-glutamate deacylase
MIPEEIADLAVADSLVMIASDGVPFETGGEQPRGAGTFSRLLGYHVRERQLLTLTDALRKITLMPARRLETFVPQMRNKGRLRPGADADITVFDPQTVADRATFEHPMLTSAGITHVIVAGTFVVKDGTFLQGVFPGQPIRRIPEVSR